MDQTEQIVNQQPIEKQSFVPPAPAQPIQQSVPAASAPAPVKKGNSMLMILILMVLVTIFGILLYYVLTMNNKTSTYTNYGNSPQGNVAVPAKPVVIPSPSATPTPQAQSSADVDVVSADTDLQSLTSDLQGL